jgi:hypothetical protein
MRRREAILVLARILNSCKPNDVTFISLEHPNHKTNSEAEGYELHLKWSIDDEAFNIINGIVSAQNLGVKEYDGRLVIYTPKGTMDSIDVVA